ncbi:MAG: aminotransferase class V-fold PLP-dependent enzyme [Acidobacteriota bacterium]|nr:aminotransferase class V-fold PLP-dependent enzyme [Acidobacteriota bacterium]
MIYLDYAATSWPKPPEVVQAMTRCMEQAGGNPGRSGHRLSIKAGRIVYDVREILAEFFHVPDPLRIIFAANATQAINLCLYGILRPGDHVLASSMEHNAVMRPLRDLESKGVSLSVVPCSPDGALDPDAVAQAMRPSTRLVVLTHASNVTGTILPVSRVADIAHKSGAFLLVDAAQSAGLLPIDVQAMNIDFLAFTGHKGLLGPQGTGGLAIGSRVPIRDLNPLWRGGTGSRSEFEIQPEDLPDKFESGTLNSPGIAGLGAGVEYILKRGLESIRAQEVALMRQLVEGIRCLDGVSLYGPTDIESRTSIVSFTAAGHRVSEIGLRLDEEFGILGRVGLHCAPAAHRTIGTFPEGTVRLALGLQTTEDDITSVIEALKKILLRCHA